MIEVVGEVQEGHVEPVVARKDVLLLSHGPLQLASRQATPLEPIQEGGSDIAEMVGRVRRILFALDSRCVAVCLPFDDLNQTRHALGDLAVDVLL